MDTKTIWYISQYASPEKYGFGTRHFYLSEEFVKLGYKVVIITSSSNHLIHTKPPGDKVYNFEHINNTDVCWIKGLSYNNPAGIKRVISWFQFTLRLLRIPKRYLPQPDIIIVSSLSLPPVLAGLYLKRKYKGSKFIFEIRDIWPQTLIEIGRKSRFHPLVILLSIIEKAGYKNSDLIVSTIPKADNHIRKIIKKPFRFHCIPQGLPKSLINSSNFPGNAEFTKLPKDKFIVGYAGAITQSNALESLIKVSMDMETSNPEIVFVLLGDGNQKKTLQEIAGNTQNLIFLNKVGRSEVMMFLKKCNLLYDSVKNIPIYQYGLSKNKWMDYMYSGKPILVSYSGYDTTINEANCGVIIPSDDANALKEGIMKFYSMSDECRTEMGIRGKEYVVKNRNFSLLARMYDECFNSLF